MSTTPRLIPDAECAQGKCGCTTTGCWDVCAMKRVPVTLTTGPGITIGAGIVVAAVPDARITDLETALRTAQATIGGLMMEVAELTAEAGKDAKDAGRYRWLAERFVGYDFYWGGKPDADTEEGKGRIVIVFECGQQFRGGRDFASSIDAQIATKPGSPA